ncbi:50 kDa hatching enzyme-like [Watersipora subatra]|uniref:50 kDa hatching enzyme-like n=1 Tax=Watersipora subatra TaxID=2589382 RepID=UPI00355BD768
MAAIKYSPAAIVLLLIGQISAAVILPRVIEQESAETQPTSVTSPATDLPTNKLFAEDNKVSRYQEAVKWLRVYKYMPQEIDHGCESCPPEECQTDCLEILQELAHDALMEFQKFYKFEQTGLLSLDEIVQMRKPRCGDTDEKPDADSKTGSRSKRWAKLGSNLWPSDMMPLQISVDRGIPGFDKTTVENIALECAKLWAEPTSLYFQLAAFGVKGNIDITFEYIDGQWGTVGLGLSPIVWGDQSSYLKLDTHETWKRNSKESGFGVSMKWAICHEMGHNLGLSHSSDKNAIMYPSGIGQNEETLPRDDFRGITTLYPGRNGKTVFARGGRPSPTSRPAPPTRRPTARRSPPTRRPTTRRPTTQSRTRATTQAPWRRQRTRPTTRAPPSPTRDSTPYRRYKPNGTNFAPPGHQPRYRPTNLQPVRFAHPPATRAPEPTTTAANYWYFDASENRWIYGTE